MKSSAKIAYAGAMAALALGLSYLETLIPLDFIAPGVRIGLANLTTVVVLYTLGALPALSVNVTRIALAALLFSNPYALLYSLLGGSTAWAVMVLCKRTGLFGTVGASVAGAAVHNVTQILIAMLTLRTTAIIAYLPILLIVGVITGLFIGYAAVFAINILKKHGI